MAHALFPAHLLLVMHVARMRNHFLALGTMLCAYPITLLVALLSVVAGKTLPFSDNATSMITELDKEAFSSVYSSDDVYLVLFYDAKGEKSEDNAAMWEGVATEHAGSLTLSNFVSLLLCDL